MNDINRILNKCVRSGAMMAEVYSVTQKSMTIRVRNGKVEAISKSTPGGTAIRYYSAGRVAFAHTTDLSDNAIDKAIAKLSNLSKKTGQDPLATLAEPQAAETDLELYAPSFAEIATESKIDYLTELEDLALKYDPLIKQSNGMQYTETISTISLVNTNNVNLSYDSTMYDIAINLASANDNEMFPGEQVFSARNFEDLPSPEKMIDNVAGRAIRLLGGTPVEPGEYEIILAPSVSGAILWGMSFAICGDSYLRGASFFADKAGKKFADSKLSVYDDALMPRGYSSRPFDGEGTASKTNTIIENGVFKSALYDLKTAAKAEKVPTGSAEREHYNDFPEIWPSNLYIAAGNDRLDDVIASIKKGIVVEKSEGWGLNGITGQFSSGINGTLIRNGKRIKSVANVTLAASNDELFNGIDAICDDLTFNQHINMPSLMIKKMHVGA